MVTAEQRRAAELLGRGFSQPEVGRVVGRSERTIRNWLPDVDGFREAVEAAQAERSDPTALATLRQALNATRKDGSADWSIRVSAAKALLAAPEPEPAPVVRVPPGGIVIYPGRDRRRPRRAATFQIWFGEAPDGSTVVLGERHQPDGCEGGHVYTADSRENARRWARDLRAGRIPSDAEPDRESPSPD